MRLALYICLFSVFLLPAQQSILATADSLYALGNYSKAVNEYAKIPSRGASLQIARAYNAIGNFDKAISQYRNIVFKDSTFQIAKFELGKLLLKTKKAAEASTLFLRLTKQDGKNPEYHYYLGEALQAMGLKEASITPYLSAVATDSTHLRSLFQLGKYFVAERETNNALKYINKGLQYYENDVALINLKALAHFNNDDYKKAQPLFEQLLALKEFKEHVYNKLAYCYYKNWELQKARETYTSLLEFDRARAEAFYGLGNTLWREKKLDSAAIYFKKAIEEKKPYLGNEYNALARLARVQEDLETALEYYKKTYQEDKENHFNYYQVCTTADQYYKDPAVRLKYYETFIAKFGKRKGYMSEIAIKRIKELKEEIHFTSN